MFIFTHDKKIYWSPSIDMTEEEFEIIGELDEESLKEIDSIINYIKIYTLIVPGGGTTVPNFDWRPNISIYVVAKRADTPGNAKPSDNKYKWPGEIIHAFLVSYDEYLKKYNENVVGYISNLKERIKIYHSVLKEKDGTGEILTSSYSTIIKIYSSINEPYIINGKKYTAEKAAEAKLEELKAKRENQ